MRSNIEKSKVMVITKESSKEVLNINLGRKTLLGAGQDIVSNIWEQ